MRPGRARSSTVLIVSSVCDGVAGDDVRAARAVRVQQAAPVRVRGARARRRRAGGWSRSRGRGPSPTSGTRACRRCRRAGARPGRRPSATTSRSPSAAGGGVPSCTQRARFGRVAVADGTPQHVVREPVDLEEVDARDGGLLARRRGAPGGDDVAVPEVRRRRSRTACVTSVFTTVSPIATNIAVERARRASTPGSIAAANRTTSPFSTSAPRPSVSTVNGSAMRTITGQTSALRGR